MTPPPPSPWRWPDPAGRWPDPAAALAVGTPPHGGHLEPTRQGSLVGVTRNMAAGSMGGLHIPLSASVGSANACIRGPQWPDLVCSFKPRQLLHMLQDWMVFSRAGPSSCPHTGSGHRVNHPSATLGQATASTSCQPLPNPSLPAAVFAAPPQGRTVTPPPPRQWPDPADMWQTTPPDALEDYVLRESHAAGAAWAIISSLDWLLKDSLWTSRASLAQELRRTSYKMHCPPPPIQWVVQLLEVLLEGGSGGGLGGGLTLPPPAVDNTEVRMHKIMRGVARHAARPKAAAELYWEALLESGLPHLVLVRIMGFLEIRIHAGTGPYMYCMRCNSHMHLAALISHVARSQQHLSATGFHLGSIPGSATMPSKCRLPPSRRPEQMSVATTPPCSRARADASVA